MKQNKKGKNYAVFCFAGKRNFIFYFYDVITSPEKEKSSANHYLHTPVYPTHAPCPCAQRPRELHHKRQRL
jgi:hypothetical protein